MPTTSEQILADYDAAVAPLTELLVATCRKLGEAILDFRKKAEAWNADSGQPIDVDHEPPSAVRMMDSLKAMKTEFPDLF